MEQTERPRKRRRVAPDHHKKLDRLPQNATVTKRPLLRPVLPSPYASAASPKVVYISSKTPFMSAVKRCEKLLRLTDKRLVQSAHTLARSTPNGGRQQRRAGQARSAVGKEDGIENIAARVEEQKEERRRTKMMGGDGKDDVAGEEVVIKGTGRAMGKVMEVGLWFQQREETYVVRLKTGTTVSIDDLTYEEVEPGGDDGEGATEKDGINLDIGGEAGQEGLRESTTVTVEKTRLRSLGVLEVYVSLR